MAARADRLRLLCQALSLSPTLFAHRLEFSVRRANRALRPGRPLSLQLMARVLRAFPEVSPYWLLCGEGEMLQLPPLNNAGNLINVNYGNCTQVIQTSCTCTTTIPALQAHLLEKERLIQLLLRHSPQPQLICAP